MASTSRCGRATSPPRRSVVRRARPTMQPGTWKRQRPRPMLAEMIQWGRNPAALFAAGRGRRPQPRRPQGLDRAALRRLPRRSGWRDLAAAGGWARTSAADGTVSPRPRSAEAAGKAKAVAALVSRGLDDGAFPRRDLPGRREHSQALTTENAGRVDPTGACHHSSRRSSRPSRPRPPRRSRSAAAPSPPAARGWRPAPRRAWRRRAAGCAGRSPCPPGSAGRR